MHKYENIEFEAYGVFNTLYSFTGGSVLCIVYELKRNFLEIFRFLVDFYSCYAPVKFKCL